MIVGIRLWAVAAVGFWPALGRVSSAQATRGHCGRRPPVRSWASVGKCGGMLSSVGRVYGHGIIKVGAEKTIKIIIDIKKKIK